MCHVEFKLYINMTIHTEIVNEVFLQLNYHRDIYKLFPLLSMFQFFRLYNGKIYNLHQFVLRHPSQILCDKKEEQANMIMLLAFNTTKVC